MNEDKVIVERFGDSYKKYSIGTALISIVSVKETLYDPLVGLNREEAYKYVKDHLYDFDKISIPIRFELMDILSRKRGAHDDS